MDETAAQAIADGRLRERAEEYLDHLREVFQETLPGNHSPAETILLAYLMTMRDGYNQIEYQPNRWGSRPTGGWHTTLGYLVDIGPIMVPFVFESRYGDHTRQLAILIDHNKPGIRTAGKQRKESILISLGASVLLFTPNEVFADPGGCAERIEAVLFDMTDAVLSDAGVIRGKDD